MFIWENKGWFPLLSVLLLLLFCFYSGLVRAAYGEIFINEEFSETNGAAPTPANIKQPADSRPAFPALLLVYYGILLSLLLSSFFLTFNSFFRYLRFHFCPHSSLAKYLSTYEIVYDCPIDFVSPISCSPSKRKCDPYKSCKFSFIVRVPNPLRHLLITSIQSTCTACIGGGVNMIDRWKHPVN